MTVLTIRVIGCGVVVDVAVQGTVLALFTYVLTHIHIGSVPCWNINERSGHSSGGQVMAHYAGLKTSSHDIMWKLIHPRTETTWKQAAVAAIDCALLIATVRRK